MTLYIPYFLNPEALKLVPVAEESTGSHFRIAPWWPAWDPSGMGIEFGGGGGGGGGIGLMERLSRGCIRAM